MNTAATAAANVAINAAVQMNEITTVSANGHQLGVVGSIVLLTITAAIMTAIAVGGVMLIKNLD